jgi:hypothetical protein
MRRTGYVGVFDVHDVRFTPEDGLQLRLEPRAAADKKGEEAAA